MAKNKYVIRAKISEQKFRELLKYFVLDIEATKVSQLTGISEVTLCKYFTVIRQRMAQACEQEAQFSGVVEVDESYFGPRRVRGKRGRGAANKIPVFGILKREGRVFTQVIKKASKAELMPIIKGKVLEGSTINSDGWKSYDGLILNGYKHHRVHHSKNEFARGKSHINGIENFWGIAKVRLSKLRGIHKTHFHLHLKECEFRFNHRNDNLYKILLVMFRKKPLKLN